MNSPKIQPDIREAEFQHTGTTPFGPPPITQISDTGLTKLWLQDLALKILYFQGYLTGYELADKISLPYTSVVDKIVDSLKREKFIEVKASTMGLGEGSYQYGITQAGINRAREALDRSQYADAAPVPLEDYNKAIRRQSLGKLNVSPRALRSYLSDLILSEDIINRVGPAINSGTSVFIYGPPGNGKTSIARAIGSMILRESIYIPYAIFIEGQVVKLYDSVNHEIIPEREVTETGTGSLKTGMRRDPRWVRIKRPFIVVGGELTLTDLDLVFNPVTKFYEAPFQVKAAGGLLLVDDFGRQQVRPTDLLNRWIIPLENQIDFLTLHTGRKVEVPFNELIVFSTNLPPKDLVDEAFLRRLRHKIKIGDPSFEEYRSIFKSVAQSKNIPFNEEILAYLIKNWYIKPGRNLRGSHPREICNQILDISKFLGCKPEMTRELIDQAADAFFVDI
ncbi:MAG: ATP-binding protein [Chloroflexota bacterium]|nr:MAG: ATP-binding protein [Chloroflexota bacterium]